MRDEAKRPLRAVGARRSGVLDAPEALFLALVACALTLLSSASAEPLSDSALASISFEQKLNTQVTLDLPFRDESGANVRLKDYFGTKPVILVLGYYECPMLCTLVLNGMVETLQDLKWSIGKEYQVIAVSIDPRETPALAAAKKRTYLKRYSRPGAAAGWHFLTGDATAVKRLADEVGFEYAYDELAKQYAHPSGLIVLTPEGKVARYLFGISFSSQELQTSLKEASGNKIGSRIQELILLCFHYQPLTGKYGALVLTVVRILGVVTVLGLVGMILTMARREKARNRRGAKTPGESARPAPRSPADSTPEL